VDERVHSQRRKLFACVGMAATALLLVILTSWPARAAIELIYFRASASTNTVLLEWATAQETNISGFIIECKRADEPDEAYHAIGARNAVGSPQQGSTYSFNVASGLEPGVAYCFRLVERTIDGLPGEQFELCGYGVAITPTPETTSEFAGLGDVTPGAIIVVPPPAAPDSEPDTDIEPAPPFTPTPTGPISPQAIPPAPDSPLPPPDEDADAAGELVPMPAPMLTPTPTLMPTFTPTQPDSPPAHPTDTPMPEEETPEPAEEALLPGVAGAPAEPDADATPTPLYFVVTATPTAEAVAVAPTFTPWPTVTPQPEFNLVEMLSPSAQNLMVMLLCLIFLTASGLGTLGLVTSVIYMRSRAQREEYIARLYGRRRH
jgi:hypothetical protein